MLSGAALVVAFGALSAVMMVWSWPWVPAVVLGVSTLPGIGLAWVIGAKLPGRMGLPAGRWQGSPARWAACSPLGAELETVCGQLAGSVCGANGVPSSIMMRERDASLIGVATVVTLVGVPLAVWPCAHPRLWVANAASDPLEIVVDGRPVGLVVGVPTEAANGVRSFRVPRGWRRLEARRLDGSVVDRSYARIGSGAVQLYIPARGASCFWVEQRAYGRAQQPRPAVVRLAADRTVHTLADRVDGWLQANPPVGGVGRWFSGGVRRVVRQGACEGREGTK
ncbi:MAG: hypothetical protein MUF54_01090 [Polyangiaceae bacterium]|nr:hypothetical protein [Polyangiaceae bacterium]